MLKRFLEVWDMDYNFQNASMLVNGVKNEQFGRYMMQDGDKIELFLE
jgi:hypothetical protein